MDNIVYIIFFISIFNLLFQFVLSYHKKHRNTNKIKSLQKKLKTYKHKQITLKQQKTA